MGLQFTLRRRPFGVAMVKLYYTPTSCGAASFISAFSEGLKVECAQVDLSSKKVLTTGEDFFRINPKGATL